MTKFLIDKYWRNTENKQELFSQYFPNNNFSQISFDEIKHIYYEERHKNFKDSFLKKISALHPNMPSEIHKKQISDIIKQILHTAIKNQDKALLKRELQYLEEYHSSHC